MIRSLNNVEAWAQQVLFYRAHLDIFIEEVFKQPLSDEQKIIAREAGNCYETQCYATRGWGKSWLAGLIGAALCVLYPESKGICFSATVQQATIVLTKLRELCDINPNIARELVPQGKSLISIRATGGHAVFKNGSEMKSLSLESGRGQRATFIFVDESLEVPLSQLESIISPILNYKRPSAERNGLYVERTKLITLSSAYSRTNPNYESVERIRREMESGNEGVFLCAIPWEAAVRSGRTSQAFIDGERARLSEDAFNMEYGAWFVGSSKSSVFPYQDIENCRVLKTVETSMPKNSTARYVISIDLATSSADKADNTIVSVLKFVEQSDGFFCVYLVYMKSYHGKKFDYLSEEIRKLYHLRFSKAEKIIYDSRGLGMGFDVFFQSAWIYNNIEYPPLIRDDIGGSNATLRAINADNKMNVRMYNAMKYFLEKQKLILPVHASYLKQVEAENIINEEDEDNDKKENHENKDVKKYTFEEKAIYIEADALQIEMGYVEEMRTPSGAITYDVKIGRHKDRYSSLAYGLDYINNLQTTSLKRKRTSSEVIGVFAPVDAIDGWGSSIYD